MLASDRPSAVSGWQTVTRAPSLDSGQVHAWMASVAAWEHREAELRELLDSPERLRADRFHPREDRLRFIVAHGLVRTLLASYLGVRPTDLAFRTGEAGKPSLDGISGAARLEYNLSHSADVVLVAVAMDAPVGVDVERWSDDFDPVELMRDYFSPAERDAFRVLPEERQRAAFFACWSRKEAYIKATGLGVSRGLDYFDVTVDPDRPGRILADRLNGDMARSSNLLDLATASGYSAALVAPAAFALSHSLIMDVDACAIGLTHST